MPVQGTTESIHKDAITEQIAAWWAEAETAVHACQIPRARRFLRWILAVQPYDEEAWLWLARLASTSKSEIAYLRQAMAFHPDSPRTLAALRQARTRQLEVAVSSLRPRSLPVHCLPDQRRNGRHRVAARNGTQAKPTAGVDGKSRSRFPSIGSLF